LNEACRRHRLIGVVFIRLTRLEMLNREADVAVVGFDHWLQYLFERLLGFVRLGGANAMCIVNTYREHTQRKANLARRRKAKAVFHGSSQRNEPSDRVFQNGPSISSTPVPLILG